MTNQPDGIGRPRGPQTWVAGSPDVPQDGREARRTPAPRLPSAFPAIPEPQPAPADATGSGELRPRRRRRSAGILVAAIALGGAAGTTGALLVAPDATSAPTVLRQTQQAPSATSTQGDAEAAAQRMLRSVVQVRTTSGSGSGFVIDDAGHVMTNHHVVDGAERVSLVLPDGSAVPGRVLGGDEDSDIAVVEAQGLAVPAVELGVSDDLRIGQQVIAVGSPLGLNGTVTSGIVSALDRTSQRSTQPLLQTDASINPGNSGGPLVDLDGRVIGVNSSIATLGYRSGNIGIGFAIPIDDAARIATEIING
ncbi:S1C family serine protease [Curtobacterium sp. NPDC087082]|uniref:S1C family serine protease n=1 Tax=Curtobacterium sp. NPDC087082 TaxID=3363966 RepID=UPI003808B33E